MEGLRFQYSKQKQNFEFFILHVYFKTKNDLVKSHLKGTEIILPQNYNFNNIYFSTHIISKINVKSKNVLKRKFKKAIGFKLVGFGCLNNNWKEDFIYIDQVRKFTSIVKMLNYFNLIENFKKDRTELNFFDLTKRYISFSTKSQAIITIHRSYNLVEYQHESPCYYFGNEICIYEKWLNENVEEEWKKAKSNHFKQIYNLFML